MSLVVPVAVALTYLFCNARMFGYVCLALHRPPPSKKVLAGTFAINLTLFFAVSLLGLRLFVNWMVICAALVLQVALLFKAPANISVYCGLQGALMGLSCNVIMRALFALVMNLPFVAFDSRYHTGNAADNYKHLPIMAGFLLAGVLFWLLCRLMRRDGVHDAADSRESTRFLNALLSGLFLYLVCNLLIYNVPAGDAVLKLWGIKSGAFALVSDFVALRHTARLNDLAWYEAQNRVAREEIEARRARQSQLKDYANLDALTGCLKREAGVQRLREALEESAGVCVCFADLNGLKAVNDAHGHEAGDRYLSAVALALRGAARAGEMVCRYGGDEFLLVALGGRERAENALREAAATLRARSNDGEHPFDMSLCYGLACAGEDRDAEALIDLADAEMYAQKRRLQKGRANQ